MEKLARSKSFPGEDHCWLGREIKGTESSFFMPKYCGEVQEISLQHCNFYRMLHAVDCGKAPTWLKGRMLRLGIPVITFI